jgi:hypothetical protein
MRDMGVRGLLVYCAELPRQLLDRDQRQAMARTSCASLVMPPPLAKPVRILSYGGFDPLMGGPARFGKIRRV